MKQKALDFLNLLAMIRELDLEKNDTDTIREVLNFIADELEQYIDIFEQLDRK